MANSRLGQPYMPTVATDNMKKYIVRKEFHVGEAEITLKPDDIVQYTRGVLLYYGEKYRCTNLELALESGYIDLADGQVVTPHLDKFVNKVRPTGHVKPIITRTNTPVVSNNEGIETVDGVEVLPDEWDNFNWTKKRAYINKMTDKDLLKELLTTEKTDAVLKSLKDRISALNIEAHDSKFVGKLIEESEDFEEVYSEPSVPDRFTKEVKVEGEGKKVKNSPDSIKAKVKVKNIEGLPKTHDQSKDENIKVTVKPSKESGMYTDIEEQV